MLRLSSQSRRENRFKLLRAKARHPQVSRLRVKVFFRAHECPFSLFNFSPLCSQQRGKKEVFNERERNKKHIIMVENATLRALCDVRKREMSITFISLRHSPSFSCEKRRDIHHRRPLSRYFSRVEARHKFFVPSLHSSSKTRDENKKRIEREREKRAKRTSSLFSLDKNARILFYTHTKRCHIFRYVYICV